MAILKKQFNKMFDRMAIERGNYNHCKIERNHQRSNQMKGMKIVNVHYKMAASSVCCSICLRLFITFFHPCKLNLSMINRYQNGKHNFNIYHTYSSYLCLYHDYTDHINHGLYYKEIYTCAVYQLSIYYQLHNLLYVFKLFFHI